MAYEQSRNFQDEYMNSRFIEQDASNADCYCEICDLYMRDERIVQMHIKGMRHLKKLYKVSGSLSDEEASLVNSIRLLGVRAKLQDEIVARGLKVIGLDTIRETQNVLNGGLNYYCSACRDFMTSIDVINHIMDIKHRMIILKSIRYENYAVLMQIGLDKSDMRIIDKLTDDVFYSRGPGEVKVYQNRNLDSEEEEFLRNFEMLGR